ncbi:hypothetical protein IV454_00835 [Massilia antarctica]|uniref:Uncharacterized protein n=1 Tax=Massilia antarctica TaxID=2765360 RepID=A0AA49A8J7_9BURK|nr:MULTISPECIES: hypothetical protein [Massilia]MCY0911381.1 hypothetical protein [Massilia sp. H27-R4]QPI50221.1 hypothetical protein IV454_00835 [Massilia antarctica]
MDTSNRLKLIRALQAAGVRPSAYSVSGAEDLALCLENVDGKWEVFYSEKGERNHIKQFSSESDACTYMYQELMADKTSFM